MTSRPARTYGRALTDEEAAYFTRRVAEEVAAGSPGLRLVEGGALAYVWTEPRGADVHLLDLYVDASLRGRGVARALVALACEGARRLTFVVGRGNEPARRFFASVGAVEGEGAVDASTTPWAIHVG